MKLHESITRKQSIRAFNKIEQRFRGKHGNKYDYSESVYFDRSTKITIICHLHGKFRQTPDCHLQSGCMGCGHIARADKQRHTLTSFVEEANTVHDNKYNYSKVNYLNGHTKICIICPEHGEFIQKSSSHLRGHGCSECGIVVRRSKQVKSKEQFIREAVTTHNKFYIYTKVVYKNTDTKVTISCPIHGDFEQIADSHLQGRGCKECGVISSGDTRKIPYNIIKNRMLEVHKHKYTYIQPSYKKVTEKMEIICPKHGSFFQEVSSHLRGRGCPKCSVTGFKYHLPAILYYLRIERFGKTYYKVGITNNTVKDRFKSDMQYITVLKTKEYSVGQDAHDKEQSILKKYKEFRYYGIDVLKIGNTELFWKDVLKFDK